MAHVGGDDLDDGLELDETLLASEGEDGFGSDDGAGFLSEDDEVVAEPSRKRSRSRSASAEDAGKLADADAGDKSAKKRRREKDKARRAAKVGWGCGGAEC